MGREVWVRWSWLRSDRCSKAYIVECFEKEDEEFVLLHSGYVRMLGFWSVAVISSRFHAFSGGYHRTHLSIPDRI